MQKPIVVIVLLLIAVLIPSYMVHADGYTMTDEEITQILAEGRARWDEALSPLKNELDLYQLWDEAEKLWTITERSVRKLVGQTFPSQQEALHKASGLVDGLIASGISILEELIRMEQERRGPIKPPRIFLPEGS